MRQRRRSTREKAYQEQLAELEKVRTDTDANDVNDPNRATTVLAAVAKLSEFADQKQKEQLLSELFVKEAIKKAIDSATEYELKGE